MRADVALVEQGLCGSRTQACLLIETGRVSVLRGPTQIPVQKPSQTVAAACVFCIAPSSVPHYVSRGGIKLAGALAQVGFNPADLNCVDFGQSTGGFTDCLLQAGAAHVVGFDVGKEQLHPCLREHPQVRFFEGVNLKDIKARTWLRTLEQQASHALPFQLAVADLSFISLVRVAKSLDAFLSSGCVCLYLVKPQFELGPEHVGKNGIVKMAEPLLQKLQAGISQTLLNLGYTVNSQFACTIAGSDGNQEYFVYATKN
ncbi:MAG: TlyA family RNA methyltransferase [Limnobacter sp.]|nr:TlyA family RNA methyltransferase [Limnobacter sp.]